MVIREKMIPAVFRMEDAEKLSETAVKLNMDVDINIAVDTGMSRIGYIPSDKSAEEIAAIRSLPKIHIRSIFTHFARADEKR